ncbi:MAG: hypothetical protein ACI9VI_001066 [Candidatus Azotimanducaceae bacterium]
MYSENPTDFPSVLLTPLVARLPPDFTWQRETYDGEALEREQDILFRDFETEYLRPDYILDTIWDFIDTQPRGYFHMLGAGGMGKSYVARGIVAEWQSGRRA